jgi:hypothetical protein
MTLATLQVAHDLLRRHIEVIAGENTVSPEERSALAEETKHAVQDLKTVAMSR